MLPILITMQISLLLYLCATGLAYALGPRCDYERVADEYVAEQMARARRKISALRGKKPGVKEKRAAGRSGR